MVEYIEHCIKGDEIGLMSVVRLTEIRENRGELAAMKRTVASDVPKLENGTYIYPCHHRKATKHVIHT